MGAENHDRPSLQDLGKGLSLIRRERGLTQAALAEASSIGVATLRRMEDGCDARMGSWLRVLAALELGARIETLLGNGVPGASPEESTQTSPTPSSHLECLGNEGRGSRDSLLDCGLYQQPAREDDFINL